MKKALLALVGVAGGLLAIGAIAKGVIAKNLNFVISGLRIGGTVIAPELVITLGVQNPSSLDYNLQSLSANVYVNNKLIGNASNFEYVLVKSNSQTPYEVLVRLSVLQLASEVYQVFQGQVAADLRLQGTVNVEHVPFPIDLTYKIV